MSRPLTPQARAQLLRDTIAAFDRYAQTPGYMARLATPSFQMLGILNPLDAYGSSQAITEHLIDLVHPESADSANPQMGGVSKRSRVILDHILDVLGASATVDNCLQIFVSHLVAIECLALANSRIES